MFHESGSYWEPQPKIVNPEPWRRVAGRKPARPQFHRKQIHGRKTKRQGRQG